MNSNYQRDKSQIPCNFFRKNGNCKKAGECEFMHDITTVKSKVIRKAIEQKVDPNSIQPNYNQNPRQEPGIKFDRFNSQPHNHNQQNQGYQGNQNYQIRNTNTNTNYNSSDWRSNRQNHSYYNNNNNYTNDFRNDSRNPPTFSIQQIIKFSLEGFKSYLPIVEYQGSQLLGIITQKSISFYPLKGVQCVDLYNKLEFKPPSIEICNAWIQEHYYQTILIVSCRQLQSTSMRTLLIYPNFLNDQTKYVKLTDVSITNIEYVRLQPIQQDLYVFSSDGYIRIFQFVGEGFQLRKHLQLETTINSAILINVDPMNFLISCNNGNIVLLRNEALQTLHQFKDHQIISMIYEYTNKCVFILLQKGEMSEIYQLKEIMEGPIYQFSKRLTCMDHLRDYNQLNYLVCANQYGEIDFLKESAKPQGYVDLSTKFLKSFSVPEYNKSSQTRLAEIKSIKVIQITNSNQVVEKFVMLCRLPEQNQSAQFFELYRVLPDI